MQDTKISYLEGLLLAIGMFLMQIFRNIGMNQSTGINLVTGLQQRSVLNTIIYKKAMLLTTDARGSATQGEIVNYMSNTATKHAFCILLV